MIWNSANLNQELESQLKTQNVNKREFLFAIITHTFPDINLPITLDFIFDENDTEKSQKLIATIRGCFNNRNNFHANLWKGYNHLAVIQVHDMKNELIALLQDSKPKKRLDSNLILCDSNEGIQCSELIKSSKLQHETFMKNRNPKIWEQNKREEMEFKSRKHSQQGL